MEQFHVGQLVGFGGGECVIERVYDTCVKLVGNDVAVDPTALTPLEPKVGDCVEGLTCKKSSHGPGVSVRGWVVKWREAPGHVALAIAPNEHKPFAVVTRASARLLSRASPPAEVKERKCYGSQPSELPRTLPDGVVWVSSSNTRCVLSGNITWNAVTDCYHAEKWIDEKTGCVYGSTGGGFKAKDIDWKTVEIQPAPTSAGEAVAAGWVPKVGDWVEGVGYGLGRMPGKLLRGDITELSFAGTYAMIQGPDCRPVSLERSSLKPISPPPAGSASAPTEAPRALPPEETKPVGGGSLKPDRYAEHRRKNQANGVEWHGHPAASSRLESGIAASRKLAQTEQAMDRPAVERHPREWPEGAGDEQELYVS